MMMRINNIFFLMVFIFHISQINASVMVKFDCTDTIRLSSTNPIIEGVAENEAPPGEAQGFGFTCLKGQESKTQIAEVPAGAYNVKCTLAPSRANPSAHPIMLEDNKTYRVTFMPAEKDTCIPTISEENLPILSPDVSGPSILDTSDTSIIRDYFIDLKPEENLDKKDVFVERVENQGKNNLGVYKITVTKHEENTVYFAKLCIRNDEPDFYKNIQDEVNIFNSLAEQENYPTFAKYMGTFTLPWSIVEQYFKEAIQRQRELPTAIRRGPKDVAVLLLEGAKGDPLKDLLKKAFTISLPELKRTFKKIGQSIGNFNNYQSVLEIGRKDFMGYIHRDLSSDNIFYDPTTKKITIIDYNSFSQGEVGRLIQNFVENIWYDLVPLIKISETKEEAIKIKTIIESLQKGIEDAFNDSPQKLAIVRHYATISLHEKGENFVLNFLKNYFKDEELPNFKQIEEDFKEATTGKLI